MLQLKHTKLEDVHYVMEIIDQAKLYFKEQGIDQWQNDYPNTNIIENDIHKNHSYVLTKEEMIIATAVISFEEEPTYREIFEGAWKSHQDYAVMHRVAVDSSFKGKGIASQLIHHTELMCKENGVSSIKIDTHENNRSMQRSLIKNEFEYCGIIYLTDGSKRVAFEKTLT